MYESFYGFRERPFDLTPNPRFLVMTDVHREALSNLEYGIASRTGITLLVGDAGTGKTTLIRTALERQPSRVHCVHLQNPALTRSEFVEMLAVRFGLSDRARESKTLLLLELEDVLKKRSEAGESTVLLIDEAQSLPRDILEEIRLLANIETSERKLLSVIMAGQPEVTALLNDESLRQLKQRVALRCELRPLTLQETAGYIAGRIRSAGGVGAQVFTREAVTLIHERSRGIPRTISVIADNALLTGFAVGQRPVNSSTVREVCRDFDLGSERDQPRAPEAPPAAAEPPVPVPALAPAPASAPTALLVLSGPADEVPTPLATPPDAKDQPSDGTLGELYGTPAQEPKRRAFSFLRG
jgi:general secretion pathway protein A